MPYTPQTWTNDVSKLNATRMAYIETGVDQAHDTADAAIPKPVSPSTNEVLVWNGTSWDADSITNAMISASAAVAVSKLAAGSDGQFLKTVGSTPTWSTLTVQDDIAIQSNTSSVGTGAATAETDLQTLTITADTLGTGDLVEITAAGTTTGSANTKTHRLYFGSTVIHIETLAASSNFSNGWIFHGVVVVTGASSQRSIAYSVGATAGENIEGQNVTYSTPSASVSGSIVIKTTGQTPNSADEITSTMLVAKIIQA